MSLKTELTIGSVSDIHLGNKMNRAGEIVENLKRELSDQVLQTLDVLFLVGDVLDRLLTLSEEDSRAMVHWASHLLTQCKRFDLPIRILEGTPGHDRKQSKMFVTINESLNLGVDLKYVDTLSIEFIERLGISVLYVPDEWNRDNQVTLDQTRELLKANGITQVDYALMHGHFDCQVPAHLGMKCHDSAAYLSLVKYLIFIGHDHTHSRHDRIIAQGSFDRIGHGQEEIKGFIIARVMRNGTYTCTLVENTGAKVFKTLTLTGDVHADHVLVTDTLKTLPDRSYIRLAGNKDHPFFANMDNFIRLYPMLIFSKKILDKDKKEKEVLIVEDKYVSITITKDNIVPMMIDRVRAKLTTDAELLIAQQMMEEVSQ